MANWRIKVKGIRPLLSASEEDREAQRVSQEIYKILTCNLYYEYFKNFNRLEDFGNGFIETTEDLNILLDDMYDYCDMERIWIDFE